MKKYKYITGIILLTAAMLFSCNPHNTTNTELLQKVDSALTIAKQQSIAMAKRLMDSTGQLPQSINNKGELVTCKSGWWVSGFYPGVLWYLYENDKDPQLEKYAREYTSRVEKEKYRTWDHDIGFIIYCSFGNGYRLTGDTNYLEVINTAAYSLTTRFDSTIGCTRSWDYASWNAQWQYPVIIDNMMNMELLMWSADKFENPYYQAVAEAHANTTMANHFRDDFSTYHVISYDTISGKPEKKNTAQGYSDSSAWARGQAWGLYGYSVMYRESEKDEYLKQATHIADFLVNHPHLPEDGIPYWDYDAPDIPNALRDASAAAIMCSALLELSEYVDSKKSEKYLQIAEKQLATLCSNEYLAVSGTNGNFILKHGVGHMPNHSEIDVPLTYADYYFVESLIRYKKLKNKL